MSILGYPLPVVLSEKLCTAVDLGAGNSRVRDYADVWTLTGTHDLNASDLLAALTATATHRGLALRALSIAIGIGYDTDRARAYTAYRHRLGPDADKLPTDFAVLVQDVVTFADPLLTGTTSTTTHWDAANRAWLIRPQFHLRDDGHLPDGADAGSEHRGRDADGPLSPTLLQGRSSPDQVAMRQSRRM